MALGDRILASLFALFLLVISLLSLALVGGWQAPLQYLPQALDDPNLRWGLGIVSVLILLGSLRLLFGGWRRSPEGEALVQSTGMGEVRVTLQALENVVMRVAHQVRGVREVKPFLKNVPGGITVSLKVVIAPETQIPVLSAELQEKISKAVEQAAGIQVVEAKVLVENVGAEARGRVE